MLKPDIFSIDLFFNCLSVIDSVGVRDKKQKIIYSTIEADIDELYLFCKEILLKVLLDVYT